MIERKRESPGLTVIYGDNNPSPIDVQNLIADILGDYNQVGAEIIEQQIRRRLKQRKNNQENNQQVVLREVSQAFKNVLEFAIRNGQLTAELEIPYFPHEEEDYNFAFNALGNRLIALGYNPEIESTMNIHEDDLALPDNVYRMEVDLVNEVQLS